MASMFSNGFGRRAFGAAVLVLAAGLAVPRPASAYPLKPIRLIVPFPPGGSTDVVARVLAEQLTQALGQTVVVENRTGANGNLAAGFVAKAEPDGYTLLFPNSSIMTIAPSIYTNLTFDPVRDFQPIVRVAEVPNLLLVNPAVPATTVKELIALAKAKPGAMALASGGSGSVSHLTGEMFKLMAGIEMLHVPYKGNAPQVADIAANQVPVGIADLSSALSLVRAGKLRALAITTKDRSALLPDVPTLEEAGIGAFESSVWVGLVTPTGTPEAVVRRLSDATNEILKRKDVRDRIAELGLVVLGGTPQEFAARVNDEAKRWKQVVATSGAKVE